jgi:hypothetical protein
VFENRVLKKPFGPKRGEETGSWSGLHNDELHKLYPYLSIVIMTNSRRTVMARAYSTHAWNRNAYRLLVGKREGKRLLGRLRRRWVDSINIDIREAGVEDMDWIALAQDGTQLLALRRVLSSTKLVGYLKHFMRFTNLQHYKKKGPPFMLKI